MTSNPLARRTEASGHGAGQMQPGEVRTITVTDPKTGAILKTYKLERTHRPYSHDLADAYNDALTREDVEWAVGDNDQLYLREKFAFTARRTREMEADNERDRLRLIRMNAERGRGDAA